MEKLEGNNKPKGNMLQNANEEDEVFEGNSNSDSNENLKKSYSEGNGNHSSTNISEDTKTMDSTSNSSTKESQLLQLFESQLKDIYWAEKALVTAIPKIIAQATSPQLIDALANHLTDTQNQIFRLENVFVIINKPAEVKKCEAMAGLLKEGEQIMAECEPGPMRDAGIIAAAQKVEHYEIATYGTLIQFAKTLKLDDCIDYLEQTLNEETAADVLLTHVAISSVNMEASQK